MPSGHFIINHVGFDEVGNADFDVGIDDLLDELLLGFVLEGTQDLAQESG